MKIERKAVLSFSEEEYNAVRTVVQVLNSYKDTPGVSFLLPEGDGWTSKVICATGAIFA